MGSASAPLQMSSIGALRGCQVPAARLGDFAGLFCLRYRHLGPRNCGHTNHVFKTERCLVVHSHGDSKEILSFYCLYDSQTEPHHAKKAGWLRACVTLSLGSSCPCTYKPFLPDLGAEPLSSASSSKPISGGLFACLDGRGPHAIDCHPIHTNRSTGIKLGAFRSDACSG